MVDSDMKSTGFVEDELLLEADDRTVAHRPWTRKARAIGFASALLLAFATACFGARSYAVTHRSLLQAKQTREGDVATVAFFRARPCTERRTSRCCGDGTCDGPETSANCAADCFGGGGGTGPGPAPPSTGPAPSPTTEPVEKPTVPTLCTPQNQGSCDCGTENIKTFVFWYDNLSVQRCFHTWNYPSGTPAGGPLPVVLHMDGYSGGRKGSERGGDMGTAAEYYGFVAFTLGNILKDGAGGFGLEFGNHGIANDAKPASCDETDSRDIQYLKKIFRFIDEDPSLDSNKVHTEGFSQNAMFAFYAGFCFREKVAGVWQGGSGQARTGHEPVAPGFQAQCTFDSYALHGADCCNQDFCRECQYWPVWPKTCSHKMVDCIAIYNDDKSCGMDWYMYEALAQEGNDARMLSFPVPPGDQRAGHKDPKNKWAWAVGCLGIVPACSGSCASSFDACMDSAADKKDYDKFATCEGELKAGKLNGCTAGCAPTLAMLQRSEAPVVTLSEGKFGSQTDLPKQEGSAPKPKCKKSFGPFDPTAEGPKPRCTPPSDYETPVSNPKDTCS